MTNNHHSKHRHSPIHWAGFSGFSFSLVIYIGARHLMVVTDGIESTKYLALLAVVAISMPFLFLELWAHDEDLTYNTSLYDAPNWTRFWDFVYRALAYLFLTTLVVKNIPLSMDEYNVPGSLKISLSFDAPVMATLLGLAIFWLIKISPHRKMVPMGKNLVVSTDSYKFVFPYFQLFILGLFASIFPLLLARAGAYYNVVNSLLQKIGMNPLPQPAGLEAIPGAYVFSLCVVVGLATSIFLTRREYWFAAIFKGNPPQMNNGSAEAGQ